MKKIPFAVKILLGFLIGTVVGLVFSECCTKETIEKIVTYVGPFGDVLLAMLKMVVYPIILFSMIVGAASIPLKKTGKVGASILIWYFCTSLFATVFGIFMAYVLNPSIQGASQVAGSSMAKAKSLASGSASSIGEIFLSLFQNPFSALANGQFLPIIVFSIFFGFCARYLLDHKDSAPETLKVVQTLVDFCDGAQKVSFKMIDFVILYFPIGVCALSFTNFAVNGTLLFGPYLRIVTCVVIGVLLMIVLIYPLAILLFCHENPYKALLRMRRPILTAFVTRSSAATLPVSFQAMNEIGVDSSLSSFSLPMGATVNMDGVCVHLPVFVILAVNMFGLHLSAMQMAGLCITIIFASVGAGGVPGGSIFLLFMVLQNLGLTPSQISLTLALALGINPILDMFETCCNVTGDNVCTYIVAKNNHMINQKP